MTLKPLNYGKSPQRFKRNLRAYLNEAAELVSSEHKISSSKQLLSNVVGLGENGENGEFVLRGNIYFKRSNLLRMEIYGYVSENYSRNGKRFSSTLKELATPPKQIGDNPFGLGLRFHRDLFKGEYSDASLSRDARYMSLAYNNCVQPFMLFGFVRAFGGVKMASSLFNENPSLTLPGLETRKERRLGRVTGA